MKFLILVLFFYGVGSCWGYSWFPGRLELGSMGLDGGLSYRLPIGRLRIGQVVAPILIEHQLSRDAQDKPSSKFQVRPLYTFAFVDGNKVIWESPTGERKDLPLRESSAIDSADASHEYLAYFGVDGGLSILTRTGYEFRYRNGSLFKIFLPDGNHLVVAANGPRISKIETSNGARLLEADYQGAKIERLVFGTTECRFHYNSDGLLDKIENHTDRMALLFSYQRSLLESVSNTFRVTGRFSWSQVTHVGWGTAFSPATLRSDLDSTYQFVRKGNIVTYTRERSGLTSCIQINSLLRKGALRNESGKIEHFSLHTY